MSSVVCRIAQGAFLAVCIACVALLVAGMAEWSRVLYPASLRSLMSWSFIFSPLVDS